MPRALLCLMYLYMHTKIHHISEQKNILVPVMRIFLIFDTSQDENLALNIDIKSYTSAMHLRLL